MSSFISTNARGAPMANKSDSKLFSYTEPSLEEIARRLAHLYKDVLLSRDPMFSWVQVTNDVTILAEELRRDRRKEAIQRASKVLWRLLEFIGYYTSIKNPKDKGLGGLVSRLLRRRSHPTTISPRLREGPTRWILVKYPFACSKCGRPHCECLLWPKVLENRREDPAEYFRKFEKQARKARKKLKGAGVPREFTLETYVEHFRTIYEHAYMNQDAWKIGMHLSEEVGEATIELSRIDLGFRATRRRLESKNVLSDSLRIAREKLADDTILITDKKERRKRQSEVAAEMGRLEARLRRDAWNTYMNLVGDKFKEEVADIFSWLAAIITKLDDTTPSVFPSLPALYKRPAEGKTKIFGCPWCDKPECDDGCLIGHSLSNELREKASKF